MKRRGYILLKWAARLALVGTVLVAVGLALSIRSITNCQLCGLWLAEQIRAADFMRLYRNPETDRGNRLLTYPLGGYTPADPPGLLCYVVHPKVTPESEGEQWWPVGMRPQPVKRTWPLKALRTVGVRVPAYVYQVDTNHQDYWYMDYLGTGWR